MNSQDDFDSLPDKILLAKDFIFSEVENETDKSRQIKERQVNKTKTYDALVVIVSLGVSLASGWSSMNVIAQNVSIAIIVGFFVRCIISGTKWYTAYKALKMVSGDEDNLKERVTNKINSTTRRTAIIIITYRDKGTLKFLTREDSFLAHAEMAAGKGIREQEGVIQENLLDAYGIDKRDILKISEIENRFLYSIKPVHDKLEMNAFAFYMVKLSGNGGIGLLMKSDIKWMTLEEMQNDPGAMSVNKDVIDYILKHKYAVTESFSNSSDHVRIIWNITNTCNYNCAICATHDAKRSELSMKEKLMVLNSIASARNHIDSIDFAGGDPCYSEDSLIVMESAMQLLGAQRVSVTTTGSGIEKLSEEKRMQLLAQCEITIDASHDSLKSNEGDMLFRKDYCDSNIAIVHQYSENIRKLVINIPLLADDLSSEEIQNLTERIVDLKKRNRGMEIETVLIRLMPVGSFGERQRKEQYLQYNPLDVAKKIKESIESNGIRCKYHCSLRAVMEGKRCEMLEHKIGIDCAGNVFACAWGGYIECGDDIKSNPFYLGNLTKCKLSDILDGKEKTPAYRVIHNALKSNLPRYYCSVVSEYAENQIFEDKDPLSVYKRFRG